MGLAHRARNVLLAASTVSLIALAAVTGSAQAQTATATVSATTTAAPTPTPGAPVPAPIESVEIVMLASAPPQWNAVVRSGLPSGCAAFHSITSRLSGTRFDVTVLNTMNVPPSGACTAIYGIASNTVRLGGAELLPNTTYTVVVNGGTAEGKQTTFTTPSPAGPTSSPTPIPAPRPAGTGNGGLVEDQRDRELTSAALAGGGVLAIVLALGARRLRAAR